MYKPAEQSINQAIIFFEKIEAAIRDQAISPPFKNVSHSVILPYL